MQLVYILFALSVVFEIFAALGPPGLPRKLSSGMAIITLSFSSGGLLVVKPDILTCVITIFSFYRVVNILRMASSRIEEKYLHRVAWKTVVWLASVQVGLLLLSYSHNFSFNSATLWLDFSISVLLFAVGILVLTLHHMLQTKIEWKVKRFSDSDLPTVTVAIPARNEDIQLETCLQSVIDSDYPKLEVVVLDDCSQDNTSQVIRKFAHDGVRFVHGDQPKPNWLAKNQAYERLYHEASGDIVLFCGVDVTFEPHTIRLLVSTMKRTRKSMMSVMPMNDQGGFSLPQAFRYMWELVPPRTKLGGPPVLSTCWLIKTKDLNGLGGFSGVSNMMTPEAYFARKIKNRNGYTFARSDRMLGLVSSKMFSEQFDTAVRVRYPQTHRRPEYVAAASLLELFFLVLPIALAIAGLTNFQKNTLPEIFFILAGTLLCTAYFNIGINQFSHSRWRFLLAMPAAVILDVAILNYSMCKYEFSEVIWKGRNVCLPVMRVYSKLPKM